MATNNGEVEKRLWAVADELRANSGLKSSEYSTPVLGLIFLRYADYKFTEAEKVLSGKSTGRRQTGKEDYQAQGVLYIRENARFNNLITLPEGENVGQKINDAMKDIETDNPSLSGILPKNYNAIENATLRELLKLLSPVPQNIDGDAFGKIYEYFLGAFARSEGAKGGEYYTPTSLVKLIVEIIEPYKGRILDHACGSGGMFVQSARFVQNHHKSPGSELAIYGEEKTADTVKLCKMNLAVHGLEGEILEGNSYYEDRHNSLGKFDFVMANPPFNVNRVDKERIKDDPRFLFGIPRTDNGNYLWIQIFYSALNATGRTGFVMANAAADAGASELEIRRQMIEAGVVDVMVAIGPNFFYTVILPCTLWFLDRGKKKTPRADKVLFIDARNTYQQVDRDRTHREFSDQQLEFLANIVRLYRGEKPENTHGSIALLTETFPDNAYSDVPGLCKAATLKEIEAQGWSLNPGRYVGVAEGEQDEFDFKEQLEELNEELETLNAKARKLEERISGNISRLLEA